MGQYKFTKGFEWSHLAWGTKVIRGLRGRYYRWVYRLVNGKERYDFYQVNK